MSNSVKATKEMVFLCFEALENAVAKSNKTLVDKSIQDPALANDFPLFVTWKMNGHLRGCIGTFAAKPLKSCLKEYAVTSGTQDHRFSPITSSEIPSLSCAVSILHSFQQTNDVLDWEVGVHGIRLFVDGCSSTYLPEVMPEQNWTKEQALSHLAKKGGYRGNFTEKDYGRAKLEKYQSSKISASYQEYLEYTKSKKN